MPYIIDGHNLIPKVRGLSLQEIDDENKLINLLQDFCRNKRKTAEVYFDNAPAGQAESRRFGPVTVHYIRQGRTADEAIRARLHTLKKNARNWIVVSSDHAVQRYAQYSGARIITSSNFATYLERSEEEVNQAGKVEATPELNQEEVRQWLDLFGETNREE
jgi:predicted RNA-binding protein with PIN domain